MTKPAPSLEVQSAAASKIQQTYRVHKSISTIKSIELQFKEVKRRFTFPEVVDFQHPQDNDKAISVSVATASSSFEPSLFTSSIPKLAYNALNSPLHTYIESLNRFLTSLDAVDSWGESRVRHMRKDLVRKIEAEIEEVEGVDEEEVDDRPEADMLKGWKGLWRRYQRSVSVHSVGNSATETEPAPGPSVEMEAAADTSAMEIDSQNVPSLSACQPEIIVS